MSEPAMSERPGSGAWAGDFVRAELGIELETDVAASVIPVDALVGLALRLNPRRAHLLVSTVLAKHVPTDPLIALAAAELLGALVSQHLTRDADPDPELRAAAGALAEALSGAEAPLSPLRDVVRRLDAARGRHPTVITVGYAETATGLGRVVADHLGSTYLASTRHDSDLVPPFSAFEEAHSHATSHRLLPTDPNWLREGGTVVLVDDELSTGRTVLNTIRSIGALVPQREWIVATLIDLRSPADREAFAAVEAELGVRIAVVALASGTITIPGDAAERAVAVIERMTRTVQASTAAVPAGSIVVLDLTGSVDAVRSDRFGNGTAPAGAASAIAAAIRNHLGQNNLDQNLPEPNHPGRTLVLGTEEFIALPLAIAAELAIIPEFDGALFSTTTRSPIAVIDRPDYAIASSITFASHDHTIDGPGIRFAYNLTRAGERFDRIIVLPEPGTDPARVTGPGSITEALAAVADEVIVALLPATAPFHKKDRAMEPLHGPAFGSYEPDDVSWLLQDLGDIALEAPAGDRERSIQSGETNYAETLPQEYRPSAEYQALYSEALERSGRRVAEAVGIVTELVLAARNDSPVLVSLARAGTPVGILMRRWAKRMRGIDVPHYTMSIVRGVGLDQTALRYLAARYDPARIMFVDGWTGKGAIGRELTAALAAFAETDDIVFGDDLAVLADPGHCVRIFGTRDDYLIPSACLNSTVSGLVSRTVYSRELIADGEFHGAKFYSELAGSDVSRDFLAAIAQHFDSVTDAVRLGVIAAATEERTPTWAGWAEVERVSEQYGIHNVNLVKPGVGETTRVLLRRVPWKILVNPDSLDDVRHVLLLAEQRGVEVELVEGLPYSCIGLIHPVHTGGATGFDGRAVEVMQ